MKITRREYQILETIYLLIEQEYPVPKKLLSDFGKIINRLYKELKKEKVEQRNNIHSKVKKAYRRRPTAG